MMQAPSSSMHSWLESIEERSTMQEWLHVLHMHALCFVSALTCSKAGRGGASMVASNLHSISVAM